jgi:hypothetical protein
MLIYRIYEEIIAYWFLGLAFMYGSSTPLFILSLVSFRIIKVKLEITFPQFDSTLML